MKEYYNINMKANKFSGGGYPSSKISEASKIRGFIWIMEKRRLNWYRNILIWRSFYISAYAGFP